VIINPLHATDFYKVSHKTMEPDGTTFFYANFTPRSDRLSPIPADLSDGKVIHFGLQFVIKDYLIDCWNSEFFLKPKVRVVRAFKRRMDNALGADSVSVAHIEALHDLGFLPICIRALPEGSRSAFKVPLFVIFNTHPDFAWLTNYLETPLSSNSWKMTTAATIADAYRRLFEAYAEETGTDPGFVDYQGHDFSCRGLSGSVDGATTSMGHLVSFIGTDTISAIDAVEDFYNADSDKELIGKSVPAGEHSVTCLNILNIERELRANGEWNGFKVCDL